MIRGSLSVVRGVWLAMACLWATSLAASDWSGVIRLEERLIGSGAATNEQDELKAYQAQLVARLERARAEERVVSPVIAQQLREDQAYFQAELERVLVATGGSLKVGTSEFHIQGNRVRMHSDSLTLVADRATNQAVAVAGGRRETATLAPLPPVRPWPKDPNAKDQSGDKILGYAVQRFTVTADGHDCQVWVTPEIPNGFALACTISGEGNKGTLFYVLAELPGMPLALEYPSGEVRDRWEVVGIEPKAIEDGMFTLP